jgi:hypothetical protein
MKPTKNTIAYNGLGFLGLITKDEQQEVEFPDGTKALAWVGIHLTDTKDHFPGDFWYSRGPEIVGFLPEPERYKFESDGDGHRYLIPIEKSEEFDRWTDHESRLWYPGISDEDFEKEKESYNGEDFNNFVIDSVNDYTFENPKK